MERGNQAECKCPLFRQGVTEGESQCEGEGGVSVKVRGEFSVKVRGELV